MSQVWNIRGTNGSGKTTLARHWRTSLDSSVPQRPVLVSYSRPTKADPDRRGYLEGYLTDRPYGRVCLVGLYETPTGGMDAFPSFEASQDAIRTALRVAAHVVAEGVLASTVFGSWATLAHQVMAMGDTFNWVYLQTDVGVCLDRIRMRQEAAGRVRAINEQMVRDKVRAVAATRTRALAAGFPVWDLPFGQEREALETIMSGLGDNFRA